MKVIKKGIDEVPIEPAHGGAGERRLYIKEDEFLNWQGMTWGGPHEGQDFTRHKHDDCDEIMFVLEGSGVVGGDDRDYPFTVGDAYLFPQGVYHDQRTVGDIPFRALFFRVKNHAIVNIDKQIETRGNDGICKLKLTKEDLSKMSVQEEPDSTISPPLI